MKEIAILNYLIQRLTNIRGENDLALVIVELEIARRAISAVPSYAVDAVVDSIFGSEEVKADA